MAGEAQTMWAVWDTDGRNSSVAHFWTGYGRFSPWRSKCGQERWHSDLRPKFEGFCRCARCNVSTVGSSPD